MLIFNHFNVVVEYKKSEWLTLLLFDVGLPTVDVYSDLSLIISWLVYHHWRYAFGLLIPILLKFILITYKWYMIEKKEDKRWSWLLLLAQVWPQWRSLRIVHLLYENDKRAQYKKQTLVSEIRSIEPFLESVPSVLIMTMIMVQATPGILNIVSNESDVDCTLPEQWEQWKTNYCAVFGGLGGISWFLATYAISIVTGTLGLTQFLQTGPCPILSQNGHFRGMLTWRFIIASLATMFALVTKVIFAGIMMEIASELGSYRSFGGGVFRNVVMNSTAIFFALNILPHIVLSLACVLLATGCNRNFFKIIFGYPAVCFLPAFTYFVVGPRKLTCDKKNEVFNQKTQLVVSKRLTILNMLLTNVLYCVVIGILWTLGHDEIEGFAWFGTILAPLIFIGTIINLIFLSLDKQFCFSKSQRCWCICCCGPRCYDLRFECINCKCQGKEIEICQAYKNI